MKKIIPVYKQVGLSSYDLVRIYKRKKNFKQKIGHGGTLDPFACGLVLLLLGEATKEFEKIKGYKKIYIAGIRLGAKSDTQDIEGEIETQKDSYHPKSEEIKKVLDSFRGEMKQKVPVYSAAKYKGKPFYKLANQGIEIERYKNVKIENIDFIFYRYPFLTIKISTFGGTYIRQLVTDITKKMKSDGFLYYLKRDQIGKYNIKDSIELL